MKQGGIITRTRILASRMQRSLEPHGKISAELMQNDANSAKPMCHTRYFERSTCSKSLGCSEVKNIMPPCKGVQDCQPICGGSKWPHNQI